MVWEMRTGLKELTVKSTSTLLLVYTDYEKPFVLCTDYFSNAMRAMISKADENCKDQPIHHASRAQVSAESNYSACEKEIKVSCLYYKFLQFS